jgi:nucleoside-diphosphate-sugar epimerase
MEDINDFYKGKNVLVTGGAGCIGSHLSESLNELGAKVTIFDNLMRSEDSLRNINEISKISGIKIIIGDILDFENISKLIELKKFDFIFHLAAMPSHRLALIQPRQYALTDVIGTINILEAARLNNVKTVVFASSNKVYGKQEPPFSEDKIPAPEGPYGQAKLSSEDWCMQYSKYYGINTPVIRYHHVLGPRTQPDREIAIFTEQVINDENPIVHGEFQGNNFISCSADYTDVRDAVLGTLLAGKIQGFDVFNLATGIQTSVESIARAVIKHLGKEEQVKIEYKEMLPHESLVHESNVTKAEKILGFRAKHKAEDSIKNYINWRLRTGPRSQAVYK